MDIVSNISPLILCITGIVIAILAILTFFGMNKSRNENISIKQGKIGGDSSVYLEGSKGINIEQKDIRGKSSIEVKK